MSLKARYSDEGIRPAVSYEVDAAGMGMLDAREVASDPAEKHHGKWDLCIEGSIPSSLDVTTAGGRFELSHLQIEELKIDGGDGHVELDMVDVVRAMKLEVSGRSATVGLRLPQRAGLRVRVHESRKTRLSGLRRLDDGSYVNDAWDQSGMPRIELEVKGPQLVVFSRKRNWRGKLR